MIVVSHMIRVRGRHRVRIRINTVELMFDRTGKGYGVRGQIKFVNFASTISMTDHVNRKTLLSTRREMIL